MIGTSFHSLLAFLHEINFTVIFKREEKKLIFNPADLKLRLADMDNQINYCTDFRFM